MAVKRWLSVLGVAAIAIGLGYAAFSVYRGSRAEQCYACQRAVHAHMRTVAVVAGREQVFCCPACALSEHEQEGRPIKITELTDFLTGAKLAPDQAFLVRGSDVNSAHGRMNWLAQTNSRRICATTGVHRAYWLLDSAAMPLSSCRNTGVKSCRSAKSQRHLRIDGGGLRLVFV